MKHFDYPPPSENHRLSAAGFVWAFMAMTNHTPPRAHYDRRRTSGDRHAAVLRHLFNRLLGHLHHCLNTRQLYDPTKGFGAPEPAAAWLFALSEVDVKRGSWPKR